MIHSEKNNLAVCILSHFSKINEDYAKTRGTLFEIRAYVARLEMKGGYLFLCP